MGQEACAQAGASGRLRALLTFQGRGRSRKSASALPWSSSGKLSSSMLRCPTVTSSPRPWLRMCMCLLDSDAHHIVCCLLSLSLSSVFGSVIHAHRTITLATEQTMGAQHAWKKNPSDFVSSAAPVGVRVGVISAQPTFSSQCRPHWRADGGSRSCAHGLSALLLAPAHASESHCQCRSPALHCEQLLSSSDLLYIAHVLNFKPKWPTKAGLWTHTVTRLPSQANYRSL